MQAATFAKQVVEPAVLNITVYFTQYRMLFLPSPAPVTSHDKAAAFLHCRKMCTNQTSTLTEYFDYTFCNGA